MKENSVNDRRGGEGVEEKASRKEYHTLIETPNQIFAEQKTLTRENKRERIERINPKLRTL